MGDAAHAVLSADPRKCTGNFFVDEEVLAEVDPEFHVSKYNVDENLKVDDLVPDFFV